MANKVTGWEGSGTRPGNRSRNRSAINGKRASSVRTDNLDWDEEKGTVYWIDLAPNKDRLMVQFADAHGMNRRDAAKALLAMAMGLLPPDYWDEESYNGAERTNLIRQIFPKGSGHTRRGPHAVWKATYDSGRHRELAGMPGGISWIGLLIEKEKLRLERVRDDQVSDEFREGYTDAEWQAQRDYANEQLRILEERDRLRKLERGIISSESKHNTTGITRPIRTDRVRIGDAESEVGDGNGGFDSRGRRRGTEQGEEVGAEHIDPYARERSKNEGAARQSREIASRALGEQRARGRADGDTFKAKAGADGGVSRGRATKGQVRIKLTNTEREERTAAKDSAGKTKAKGRGRGTVPPTA